MTRHRYSTLLLFSLLLTGFGASAQTVTGRLVDPTTQAPVEFANVLLMNAADSVLAKAELSDADGRFTLVADSGRYYLEATMIGYGDFATAAFTLRGDTTLGTVDFGASAKTLSTAVVTHKRPFLEQQAGKMIVNVENSITGQTGSAEQLLRKVPGLVVRQGQVSMAGSAGVTILIDGKPTRYMDMASLLRDLPASDISKIEVISQPGAAFDAQGNGGVINIVLKKNVRLGTNGSVTVGLGRGRYDKLNTNLQLSHRAGPLNVYGSAGYRRGSGFDQLILDREVIGARVVQDNVEPSLPNTASLRGGVDYDLTERTTVGASGTYRHTRDDATGTNSTLGYGGITLDDPISAGTPLFELATLNTDDQRRVNYAADAYYRWKIDTAGRRLEADLSYGAFDRDGRLGTRTDLRSGTFDAPIFDIRNRQLGATRVAAGQVDYTNPLKLSGEGRTLSLKTGAKYSYADVDADLQAQSRTMGTERPFANDARLTNRFLYRERIAAGYVSADAKFGEVSANAGLRYEHTYVDGENVTSDSSFVRDYGGWFPSFGVSLPVKGKIGASLAYSYRLNRPNYTSLNPFVRFLDPLTIQRGNTMLRPEYAHSAQFNLNYGGQPFFRLAYERTDDVIALVTEQNPVTKITEGYDRNLDTYTRYGGHLFAPLSFIPKVDGYFGGMAYYDLYESNFLGGQLDQGGWSFTGFANANVELPLKLKAELNFWIQSGGQRGMLQNGTVYGSSVGLQRKFMDDQLTLGHESRGCALRPVRRPDPLPRPAHEHRQHLGDEDRDAQRELQVRGSIREEGREKGECCRGCAEAGGVSAVWLAPRVALVAYSALAERAKRASRTAPINCGHSLAGAAELGEDAGV